MFGIHYAQNPEESCLSTTHSKDSRIRPRRICKGSNFRFSHPITVSGVLKEATTALTEIFLYVKELHRDENLQSQLTVIADLWSYC